MISDSEAILVGGQGERNILCKDAMWKLNLTSGKWSPIDVVSGSLKPEARMGHSAVFDPLVRGLYTFGGSKNKKWFSDVSMLDTDTLKWQNIKVNGNAPKRAYHSCTLCNHELWIFGGTYPQPDPVPDACSNDIHVFSLIDEMWYMPLVMGTRPPARSGHSATLFQNRLVIFGGWDAPVCYNDVYILDLSLVEWSKPDVKGTAPSPRSWHSACALSGNRLLIHGGYSGNEALSDGFIFDLDKLTWTPMKTDPPVSLRTGHVALCLPYRHEVTPHDDILLFGGGDNESHFFNDLISLTVALTPVTNVLTPVQT